MWEILQTILSDYTLQIVALGAIILGITTGSLGAFAVLRQQSLLGDAISHATLPGVGLAFLLTQEKSPLVLLIGAALAGCVGTFLAMAIVRTTRIKQDTALGMILSVFFGAGLVLLTMIQKLPDASKAGLNKFLFGNAATLLKSDIYLMSFLALIAFTIMLFNWKEFKILVFDYDYARSIGLPVRRIEFLLTGLMVLAIVLGLQMVGVVLMSAMLVAPAAAARQWTDRLSVMVILSAIFGACAGCLGALTSSLIPNLPTGPTIVVFVSFFVLTSLIFAPNRGLLWDWFRVQQQRKRISASMILKSMLIFSQNHVDPYHPHDIAAIKSLGLKTIEQNINDLQKHGWVKRCAHNQWALTAPGLEEAKRVTLEFAEGSHA